MRSFGVGLIQDSLDLGQSGPVYSRSSVREMTASAAKTMGRSREQTLQPDWDRVKDNVMRRAVRAKFERQALRADLLGTGDIQREPLVTPREAALRIAALSTIPDTQWSTPRPRSPRKLPWKTGMLSIPRNRSRASR